MKSLLLAFFSRSLELFFLTFFLQMGSLSYAALPTAPSQEASTSSELAPWAKPRELSNFQALLKHSPFSLATTEESSPLSERYAITGIINLDGEDQLFVIDKNDQSRELLTKKPNTKSMALVSVTHEPDPNKMKATIRVNGETGVISGLDLSTNAPTVGPQRFMGPGAPGIGKNMPHLPPGHFPGGQPPIFSNGSPGSPFPNSSNLNNPNNRRVITVPPIPVQSPSKTPLVP